jgi:hypothetical protein
VSTISSSVVYSSGSNIFGNSLSNTQVLTGSVGVTGSLTVRGNEIISGSSTITGSLTVSSGITGSLFGTASQAVSSSFAFTASSAISSSLAQTASFALRGNGSFTGSFSGSVTASLFGTASQATSASFATTASTVIATVTGTNSTELVRGNMADNDQFRILVGGTATNAGFAEIATADDGTEPIHVRQYSGVFASLVRTATLLDGSGNTSFPGTVSAAFSGNLTGTASFALRGSGSFTGSFSGSVTGSLFGTASQAITASYILASGVVGLNLSLISTGSVSASVGQSSSSFQVTSGSNTLMILNNSGSLTIGSSPASQLVLRVSRNITGNAISRGVIVDGQIQSDVTTAAHMFSTSPTTVASAFTLPTIYNYYASGVSTGSSSVVTDQHGFYAESNMVNATNNYGFFGNIPSGTNRWNIYMSGTANNYLAGSLGIGSTSLTGYNFRMAKNITGATVSINAGIEGQIQSDVTSQAFGVRVGLSTAAAAFSVTDLFNFRATNASVGGGSSIGIQYGFAVADLTSGGANYAFESRVSAGANKYGLYFSGDASNYLAGSLGIGTTGLTNINLAVSKNISGSTTSYGIYSNGTIQSGVTTAAIYNVAFINTAAASFTVNAAYAYYAGGSTIGAGSAISQQHGFYVHSSLVGATVNYAYRSALSASTGVWNLYMDGSAQNFLSGSLGIGQGKTVPTAQLDISGSALITGSLGVTGPITGSSILSTGTITAQTLVVTTVSSSVVYSSGSNIFGNSTANTQTMTGSLNVSGSSTIIGRVTATDITGSLFGTASQATTASFALRGNGSFTGSFSGSVTASLFGTASQAVSSSYALTASFALNGGGGASFPFTGSAQITGSLGVTGSFSLRGNQGSSVFSSNADTLLITGSLIITGSGAITGSLSVSSGITGSLFGTASQAVTASYALTASFVASIAGLSTSQIATGSITASVSLGSGSFAVTSGSSTFLFVSSSGNVGINNVNPLSKLQISGDSSTDPTTNIYSQLEVVGSTNSARRLAIGYNTNSNYGLIQALENATNFRNLILNGLGGNVGVATQRPSASLDVSGSVRITNGLSETGSVNISGSVTVTGSITTNGTITAQTLVVQTITSSITYSSGSNIFGNALTNTQTMTGSVNITGSLNLYGNQNITGSLNVSGSLTLASASLSYQHNLSLVTGSYQVIASAATGSYRCAFFDYVMFSGSIVRAGTVTSTWSGSATEYYENYTADLGGSTSGVVLQTAISSSTIQLQATASTAAWTIRSLIRLL